MTAPDPLAERFAKLVNPIIDRHRKVLMISERRDVYAKLVPSKMKTDKFGRHWVNEGDSASMVTIDASNGELLVTCRPTAMKDLVNIESWTVTLSLLNDGRFVEGIVEQLWLPIVKMHDRKVDQLTLLYFLPGFRERFTEADYELLGLEPPVTMAPVNINKVAQAKAVWGSW